MTTTVPRAQHPTRPLESDESAQRAPLVTMEYNRVPSIHARWMATSYHIRMRRMSCFVVVGRKMMMLRTDPSPAPPRSGFSSFLALFSSFHDQWRDFAGCLWHSSAREVLNLNQNPFFLLPSFFQKQVSQKQGRRTARLHQSEFGCGRLRGWYYS